MTSRIYRLIQSASDIFLGWTQGKLGRHFYIRELKDMKLSPLVDLFNTTMMIQYARSADGPWHAPMRALGRQR